MNRYLPEGIVAIHHAFDRDRIPHAFGGAVALAYWGVPRATIDLDINVFLSQDERTRVLDSLAPLFPIPNRADAERQLEHAAQVRLRWGTMPVDLFFSNSDFHDAMAGRSRVVDYVGTPIPVLSAEDLILCKAAFNRPKDWLDIETIVAVQQHLDEAYLHHWLDAFADPEDERLARVDRLLRERQGRGPERG